MPLYMIRREIPGLTQADVDAASYRAIACAFYYTNLRWVTSYWDQQAESLRCVYEAENADQVIDHARRARIPCDEVIEVQQFGPETYTGDEAPEMEKIPAS